MPRLTKDEHEGYMRAIMDRFENPDDAADMITALRNDFDASLEVIDSGDSDERYNTLREKYIERFFGGNADLMEEKDNQAEDIKEDSKPLTYEALFENAESYTGKDE